LIRQEGILESYIIRIYRRENNDPRNIVGIVEEVEGEERKAFTNLDELWNILKLRYSQEGGGDKGSFGIGGFEGF
jgi:hypothetical protein